MKSKLPILLKNENKVKFIRGEYVILDSDLATYFGVKTKQVNQAVKRNKNRFPEEIVFQLTDEETQILRSQTGTSSSHGGSRTNPYVFTEIGCWTLTLLLRSQKAEEKGLELLKTFQKIKNHLQNQSLELPKPLNQALSSPSLNLYAQNITINTLSLGDSNVINQKINDPKEIIHFFLSAKELVSPQEDKLVSKLDDVVKAIEKKDKLGIKGKIEVLEKTLSTINSVSPAVTVIKTGIQLALGYFGLK